MLRVSSDEWPVNVGLLGCGWIIKRHNMEIARGFGVFLPNCAVGSNAAKYLALIEGLEALADLQIREAAVEIRGDAKCVIDQMFGYAGMSSPLTRTLNRLARKLAGRFTSLNWVWVTRRTYSLPAIGQMKSSARAMKIRSSGAPSPKPNAVKGTTPFTVLAFVSTSNRWILMLSKYPVL